jgi:hypothetical protein
MENVKASCYSIHYIFFIMALKDGALNCILADIMPLRSKAHSVTFLNHVYIEKPKAIEI